LTEPTPLAVVLDALAAPAEPALRAWLGPEADDALRAALREHALDWARAAGGGAEPLQRSYCRTHLRTALPLTP
jgi:hypothetical protein